MADLRVSTYAVARAAALVTDSAEQTGSDAGALDAAAQSCAPTPTGAACEQLAAATRTALAAQATATLALARALSTAAISYALAEESATTSIAKK